MGIGAAVAGASAVAGIGGALISSSAAKSAAQTQANAATTAANLQEKEQQQVRSDLMPYNATGQIAEAQLAGDLSGANPTGELTQLQNTPGYNFALTQGLESTQNGAAARGLGTSGAALKGAAQYAEGLAENTYQQNLLNPLLSVSQIGEGAAAQTGISGTTGAANAGAGLIGAGNATAGGTVGAANNIGSALGAAGGAPANYLLYQRLLSPGSSGDSGAGFYANAPGSIPGGGSGNAPSYG